MRGQPETPYYTECNTLDYIYKEELERMKIGAFYELKIFQIIFFDRISVLTTRIYMLLTEYGVFYIIIT